MSKALLLRMLREAGVRALKATTLLSMQMAGGALEFLQHHILLDAGRDDDARVNTQRLTCPDRMFLPDRSIDSTGLVPLSSSIGSTWPSTLRIWEAQRVKGC